MLTSFFDWGALIIVFVLTSFFVNDVRLYTFFRWLDGFIFVDILDCFYKYKESCMVFVVHFDIFIWTYRKIVF